MCMLLDQFIFILWDKTFKDEQRPVTYLSHIRNERDIFFFVHNYFIYLKNSNLILIHIYI